MRRLILRVVAYIIAVGGDENGCEKIWSICG